MQSTAISSGRRRLVVGAAPNRRRRSEALRRPEASMSPTWSLSEELVATTSDVSGEHVGAVRLGSRTERSVSRAARATA